MTVEIPLTKGYTAIVDDEDGDLAERAWRANTSSQRRAVYAVWSVQAKHQHKSFYMHRAVAERTIGRLLRKGEIVDHINGNGLDNRRANLRVSTVSQNAANQHARQDKRVSYKGVTPSGAKFVAQIRSKGLKHYLGTFDTPEEGHAAYCEAAKKYHGEFARFE